MIRKTIIDNYRNNDLAPFLNSSIQKNNHVSIATGFFNVGGYALLKKSLHDAFSDKSREFRLIVGRNVVKEPLHTSYESLRDELEHAKYDEYNKNNVDDLIKFLNNDNVFVRTNEDKFTHAKCYVFDSHVIVGSSNFTHHGLQYGAELNAVLYSQSHIDDVKRWFDRMWNKSIDSKADLISALDASKFGRPIEPYMMYMKMLYEYHKQRLEDIQSVAHANNILPDFQKHAVVSALKILRKHKGVIIADSTGLGKTHIGIELLKKKVGEERKKTLLIAPKQVLDSVWNPKLENELIKVIDLSIEKTGSSNFEPSKYVDKVDVIMIDESHNYRSGSTARHNNLMKLLAGGKKKEVILLTATPVNNSLMDLYYQLSFITAGNDTYFSSLNIPNLYKHFRKLDKKPMLEGANTINSILYEIMIKRTRQSIKENYPDLTMTIDNKLRTLSFPERRLHKIEYSLTKLYGDKIYQKVLDLINNVHLVPYRIESYNQKSDDIEKQLAIHRSMLQQTFLMKRFESSIEAIRNSLQNLEKFYYYFEHALKENKVLNSKSFRKLLDSFPDEDAFNEEDLLAKIKHDANLVDLHGYDKIAISTDLQYDLTKIKSVLKEFSEMKGYADSKLTALIEDIIAHKALSSGGKKVVIFTSFIDTASYIKNYLDSNLTAKIVLLTGKTPSSERANILKQFAPKANNHTLDPKDEAQVLVSTDVLSEGQNLQDCNYVINYDLPWNPMKLVQRVGRVDRLTSEFPYITSAVFIPEKELDSMLKLLENLQKKIIKIGDTVGVESTIFGEPAKPKDFNALEKIKRNDPTLIADMERSVDVLSSDKPFDILLKVIQQIGKEKLQSIPLGKRSGRDSSNSGLVLLYRNVITKDMHFLFYNYPNATFEHIDDLGWIFPHITCESNELLSMPFTEKEDFQQVGNIDKQAKDQILRNLNINDDTRNSQNIGSRKQRQIKELIAIAHRTSRISTNDVSSIYKILTTKNLSPWDSDLSLCIDDYNNTHDLNTLIIKLKSLFLKYGITADVTNSPVKIENEHLRLIGCMFLNGDKMTIPKLA